MSEELYIAKRNLYRGSLFKRITMCVIAVCTVPVCVLGIVEGIFSVTSVVIGEFMFLAVLGAVYFLGKSREFSMLHKSRIYKGIVVNLFFNAAKVVNVESGEEVFCQIPTGLRKYIYLDSGVLILSQEGLLKKTLYPYIVPNYYIGKKS